MTGARLGYSETVALAATIRIASGVSSCNRTAVRTKKFGSNALIKSLGRRMAQIPGARALWERFPVGSLATRVRYGIFPRPNYAFGVFSATEQARKLGIPNVSVIEFGVAGGRGLRSLEAIAAAVSRETGIGIQVFGFDTGEGMPAPLDYRDCPHVWDQGFYRMDQDALRASLKHAKLVLGDVSETVPAFLEKDHPPVGFVSFDLDYYSSTKSALQILKGAAPSRLPRVLCYFDDICYPEDAYHNEWIGELCAIREFNCEHSHLKVAPIHMLAQVMPYPARWHYQMYACHDFQHPLYCVNLTPKTNQHTQIPL